jgi:dipeptidyl aminopeptidase/acylaminoacyl peptidase
VSGRINRTGRRRAVGIGIVVVLLVLIGGYLYAGSTIYDTVSVAKAKCDGLYADNTPGAFTVEGVDTDPYVMPTYEEVTLPSRDPEVALSAWYMPPDDGGIGSAVVIVHGHNSCKRSGRILLAAGMLHRDGIGVLLIDLRNHGDSTVTNGRFAGGIREYRDALGGWDWLVGHGYPADRVGLFGHSLGAATVLIATGEEPRVAATWEDSSYADVDVAIQAELERHGYPTFLRYGGYLMARLKSGDDLTSLSPIGAVAKLDGRPIFITHGTADTRLSVEYAYDLADAVRADGGTVDPWIVEGAEHTLAIQLEPAEYERRLDAFFESALGGAAG